jgi:NAD(P)-dependent dehydrogenase (short-subunit alcohol dehydrogenase family)
MPVALITGASRGLGLALARSLAADGWSLVIDARHAAALDAAATDLRAHGATEVVALAGSVADAAHRTALVDAARSLGRLDVLVNNASALGPSPLPPLAEHPLDALEDVYRVNVVAPVALVQAALPLLLAAPGGGRIVNVSSDAAVEAYPGWGGYGSSKAALDHATRVLAEEQPSVRVYAVDPGDMNTQMHQEAFPGEDISDRPPPSDSVPGILNLVRGGHPSGRYSAAGVPA